MTRKTKLTDELDAYQEQEDVAEVATAEFKTPSFTLLTDTKRIDVFNAAGADTNTQIQYRNLFGLVKPGRYTHGDTEVHVSDR